MEHEIDLGDELVINVKYAGQEYKLREPRVDEIDKFRARADAKEGDSMDALVMLMTELGMPKEVIMKMGMSKVRDLIDWLMATLTKKK